MYPRPRSRRGRTNILALGILVAVAFPPELKGTQRQEANGRAPVTAWQTADHPRETDRVLVRSRDVGPDGPLPWDRGALGVWQRLQKLRTTGSLLYTAGHPDDEEAGILTLLSRGEGVRTALLTLNRGEGGANAIGPELFDALGIIRSEELRLAGRYYGLDDQYFTTAADYGYSKTLDEAFRSWDRESILEDMVRVIRTNRPLVVISRWHGSERDGHGHHQASGVLTPEAVAAAADPARFPDQIAVEGLRPWRVRKVYRGQVQDGEPYHVEIDRGRPSPWIGQTFQELGAYGLSLQRSQTAGRIRRPRGQSVPTRYERIHPRGGGPEHGIFDGLATTLTEVFDLTDEPAPADARSLLMQAEGQIRFALAGFDIEDPSAVAPYLASARARVADVLSRAVDAPEASFILALELRELDAALIASLGVELEAHATAAGDRAHTPLGSTVPGQGLDVHWELSATYTAPVDVQSMHLRIHLPDHRAVGRMRVPRIGIDRTAPLAGITSLTVPHGAEPTRPWYQRGSIARNTYSVADSTDIHLGESRPPVRIEAVLSYAGERLTISSPVRTVVPDPPYGVALPTLIVTTPVSVGVRPDVVIRRPETTEVEVTVEVTSHTPGATVADVGLEVPTGWSTVPLRHEVRLGAPGQRETVPFTVSAPRSPTPDAPGAAQAEPVTTFTAVATVEGREIREGFRQIEHRDLETQRLYAAAEVRVVPVDVVLPPGLRVGYVMGVGDQVPGAMAQLGARVTLLAEADLAAADLTVYDAIFAGTRAYAVRDDLVSHNERLLDYARAGGHLVVLYQTPEYEPELQAPYAAVLPGNAEEVSEEDAPVRILAPDHPMLTAPNPITTRDFDHWIEQRGSKFFSSWSSEYTPLIETHDTGQAPQEGVWLTAPVGAGQFTYASIALHRQLPYGVGGAWRILANLMSFQR